MLKTNPKDWLCMIVVIMLLKIIGSSMYNSSHQENCIIRNTNIKHIYKIYILTRVNKSFYVVLTTLLDGSLKQDILLPQKDVEIKL